MCKNSVGESENIHQLTMKIKLILTTTVFILAGLSSCKDDCLTCPNNEAVVNGQCECIGVFFNGVCTSEAELLSPNNFSGPTGASPDEIIGYISYADTSRVLSPTEKLFDFWDGDIRLFLIEITFNRANNRYESYCSISTPRDNGKQYFSSLLSPIGMPRADTLRYYWPSAYDYNGFVTTTYYREPPAGQWAKHYTTEIDEQTCYLRPYIKILDKDVLRVTFRYVTSDEVIKAEFVRLFQR